MPGFLIETSFTKAQERGTNCGNQEPILTSVLMEIPMEIRRWERDGSVEGDKKEF